MKRLWVLLVLLTVASVAAFAQTDSHTVTINVNPVAVIALNDTSNITFDTTDPALPGNDPGPAPGAPATNATKRLWYTVCSAAANYRITVEHGATAPPAGTTLAVEATSVEGGAITPGGPFPITAVAQDIADTIGSVATGRGGGDGTALTYSFWVDTPASLSAGTSAVVTVTYTITNT